MVVGGEVVTTVVHHFGKVRGPYGTTWDQGDMSPNSWPHIELGLVVIKIRIWIISHTSET